MLLVIDTFTGRNRTTHFDLTEVLINRKKLLTSMLLDDAVFTEYVRARK
jgi:hypothetical protein